MTMVRRVSRTSLGGGQDLAPTRYATEHLYGVADQWPRRPHARVSAIFAPSPGGKRTEILLSHRSEQLRNPASTSPHYPERYRGGAWGLAKPCSARPSFQVPIQQRRVQRETQVCESNSYGSQPQQPLLHLPPARSMRNYVTEALFFCCCTFILISRMSFDHLF